MKVSFAILALIGATEARHRLGRRSNVQIGVRFAAGATDEQVEEEFPSDIPKSNLGVRFVQSDPIHGSLGPPKIPMGDLTPEQQFELKQRRTPKPTYTDDENVTATLDSIKTAEEIVGGSMYDPNAPAEKAKVKPTPEYKLADSDDETEDTVETRRSVKWAENELKQRWFINRAEKLSFEDKVARGEIRPEVLEFRDKSDADPQESQQSMDEKEAGKKAALKEKQDAKKAEDAKKEADKGKTEEEKKAEATEAEDAAAKKKAAEAGAEEDKAAKDGEAKKKKGDEDAKATDGKKDDFVPPELKGIM